MAAKSPSRKSIISVGFGNNPAAAAAGVTNVNEIVKIQGQKAQDLGFDLIPHFMSPESAADGLEALEAELRKQTWDGVIVGGGVRMRSEHTLLFEKIVNTVVQESKGASKLIFPGGPDQIVPALVRSFPEMAPSTSE